MPRGRPRHAELVVAPEDRAELLRWTHRRKSSHGLAQRAGIVLRCAEGQANTQVAAAMRINHNTVGKWRRRFIERGLAGLLDEPRAGAPRTIGDDQVEAVLTTTLEAIPPHATHWSTRSLASRTGMSHASVRRIWQAFGLQPHRVEHFKLSPDPQFIEKVRDIVGLYLNPPDKALVLCVDEKSQIQALDRTRPILPLRPGLPQRQTHDYKRHGTTTLFAAFNIMTGKVIGSCQHRHRSREVVKFLNHLEKQLPADQQVHLIMDNYCTHKSVKLQRWLKPKKRRRFHFHFTPTSTSWLNQVERWFGLITDRMIRRGTFLSVQELEQSIYEWLAKWNHAPKSFVWKATADVILNKVRSCKELSRSPH